MSDVLSNYQALEQKILAALEPAREGSAFAALALEIHAFQRRWNEPYCKFCTTRPEPATWRDIPAVPQSVFKRFALTCVPPPRIGHTFLTSGTTGEARGAHYFLNLHLYDAAARAGWHLLGLPRLRQIILAPSPDRAPQSSLSHMFATLGSESDDGQAWCFDEAGKLDLERTRNEIERAQVSGTSVLFLGTALAFLHLFEVLPSDQPMPAGSVAMETGGFKGSGRDISKTELYAKFARHLGLKPEAVINEYGMTELSSQFYTRDLGRPHSGGPWVRALVIDPESGKEVAVGETGILRIFDLANLNSVLALETQDLAIRREDGFELLGRDPAALPRGCSRAADEGLRR